MARRRTHLCRPRALRSVAKERNRDNNLMLLARPMDIAGTNYKILCCVTACRIRFPPGIDYCRSILMLSMSTPTRVSMRPLHRTGSTRVRRCRYRWVPEYYNRTYYSSNSMHSNNMHNSRDMFYTGPDYGSMDHHIQLADEQLNKSNLHGIRNPEIRTRSHDLVGLPRFYTHTHTKFYLRRSCPHLALPNRPQKAAGRGILRILIF